MSDSAPSPGGPAAVIVNHEAGAALIECVRSLQADGATHIVVVDNASSDDSIAALQADQSMAQVSVVCSAANLGYGAGANQGWTMVDDELVVVSNPDVVVHRGALDMLSAAFAADAALGLAGPQILEVDGSRYPSARRFPSWIDAAGHAVLGAVAPGNRFTERYRMSDLDPERLTAVDWVSGAFFMARRSTLAELGGFDERYFMYLEDVDLCWRAHRAGYGVAYVPDALVTHVQGLSTGRRPYRMLVEHHRSALRFASRRASGWHRIGLVPVALVLGARLVMAIVQTALSGSSRRHGASAGAD